MFTAGSAFAGLGCNHCPYSSCTKPPGLRIPIATIIVVIAMAAVTIATAIIRARMTVPTAIAAAVSPAVDTARTPGATVATNQFNVSVQAIAVR